MAFEEKGKLPVKPHHVIMEDRSKLSVTGVEDVISFDEAEIITRTAQGNLIIRGTGLHIGKLTLDSGEVSIDGLVRELCYEETAPATGFWARLFG
ncbi:MAG: sporulation protein YabP [Oscillospiraceae bacterium]|nr:sporulation protein YabP [Oscillospiraceae bacterium]